MNPKLYKIYRNINRLFIPEMTEDIQRKMRSLTDKIDLLILRNKVNTKLGITKLMRSIREQSDNTKSELLILLTNWLKLTFRDYITEYNSGVNHSKFITYDEKKILSIVSGEIRGQSLSSYLSVLFANLNTNINIGLNQELVSKETVSDSLETIKYSQDYTLNHYLNTTVKNNLSGKSALLLGSVINDFQIKSIKNDGGEKVIRYSLLLKSTCNFCRGKHEKVYDINNITDPVPSHGRCFCWLEKYMV